jgi:hypothetical protein
MLVSLIIMSVVVLAVLGIFDFTSKLARAQTQITDMQQSLRAAQYDVVRLIRMAGRGPVPLRTTGKQLPTGLAIEVFNNVPVNTRIGFTDDTGPDVLEGTDILTIRGVFESSLYYVQNDPAFFTRDPATGTGSVTVLKETPTGIPHNFGPIVDAICDEDNTPEGLLLASQVDDSIFAVVELDPATTRAGASFSCPVADLSAIDSIVIQFKTSGSPADKYLELSPGGVFPPGLRSVSFVGIVEEYRFYIREDFSNTGGSTTGGDTNLDLTPHFTRARVFPGTDIPYKNQVTSWRDDIADNLFDLQVVMGIDANDDGTIVDLGEDTDEWLFNHPDDDPTIATWNTVAATGRESRLYNLRLTTLARTGRRDRGYQAPVLTLVEDHSYSSPPSDRFNEPWERTFRRRTLETRVDMRNVS